ncbi:hypothetical protein Q5752_000013 [Cryptotrichosporon argae]
MDAQTVTLGRAKRSTAGNRMRELLDQAHAQDADTGHADEGDDEEFEAPADVRDVYLEEFADTEDEASDDEDVTERAERREARKQAKTRTTKGPNALLAPVVRRPAKPDLGRLKDLHLLDPSLDPTAMAPSSLILALRKSRRDAKREARDEALRSTLRASTLRTEAVVLAKEAEARAHPTKMGRRAQHETGEVRGLRPMSQAELIARALEEEERNREGLRERNDPEDRDNGTAPESVSEDAAPADAHPLPSGRDPAASSRLDTIDPGSAASAAADADADANAGKMTDADASSGAGVGATIEAAPALAPHADKPAASSLRADAAADAPAVKGRALPASIPTPKAGPTSTPTAIAAPSAGPLTLPHPATTAPIASSLPVPTPAVVPATPAPAPYTRNYLLLSSLPTATTLSLILGAHADWTRVAYVPARQRPLHRRPPACAVSGAAAAYRDPRTGVGYADKRAYAVVRAVLGRREPRADKGVGTGEGESKGEGEAEAEAGEPTDGAAAATPQQQTAWGWDEAGWLVEPPTLWAEGAADVFAPRPAPLAAEAEACLEESVKAEAGEGVDVGTAGRRKRKSEAGEGARKRRR